MTTIDQRILIPAAQSVVWEYISDLNNNPSWQADCQNISFLTSKREGPGTRWRYATNKRRDYVAEITAWYNGLGYEYVFIDGPPYRNNRGRIRLQEIAEGTIVQWTFSYEVGGVLAGVRSSSRQVETNMATSLKTLYRQIKQQASDGTFEAKSLMRAAPDVEGRSQYKPRHPSIAKEAAETEQKLRPATVPTAFNEPPVSEGDGQALQAFEIDEPPVAVDDTRPRPAVTGLETDVPPMAIPADVEGEPEFLADMSRFAPPRDTAPKIVTSPVSADADQEPDVQPEIVEEPPSDVHDTQPRTLEEFMPPAAESIPPSVKLAALAKLIDTTSDDATSVVSADEPAEAESEEEEMLTEPLAASQPTEPAAVVIPAPDTKSPSSIWEVFGVPRPSETQEHKAVSQEASQPIVISATSADTPHGEGLRIALRRKLVHLRRPL
jgi:hypothetical protein